MSNSTEDAEYVRKPSYDESANAEFYAVNNASLIMTVMSTISVMCSLTILLAFATLLKNRATSKGLLQIIVYIAASNMLTSLGSIVGQPLDRSFACWWEGIITNIFTLSSIYWCVDVILILYQIVVLAKARHIGILDHLVCWGIPIIATLLPFINFTYGSPGGGDAWCFVVPHDDLVDQSAMSIMWFWVAYYGHVWLCIGIMIALFIRIWFKIQSHAKMTQGMLLKIFRKLQWYPAVILISWTLACIVDTISLVDPDFPEYATANVVSSFFACSQGTFTAIVFWTTMDEAKSSLQQSFKRVRASIVGEMYVSAESGNVSSSSQTSLSTEFDNGKMRSNGRGRSSHGHNIHKSFAEVSTDSSNAILTENATKNPPVKTRRTYWFGHSNVVKVVVSPDEDARILLELKEVARDLCPEDSDVRRFVARNSKNRATAALDGSKNAHVGMAGENETLDLAATHETACTSVGEEGISSLDPA